MSKCSYCSLPGHKITTCVDPSIRDRVTRIETTVSYRSLCDYLEWSSTNGLSVLCAYFKLGISGTIKEKREKIALHWIETHQEAARATAPEDLYRKVFPVRNDRVIPIRSPVQTQTQTRPQAVVATAASLSGMLADLFDDDDLIIEEEEPEVTQVARQIIATSSSATSSSTPTPNTTPITSTGPLSIQLPSEPSPPRFQPRSPTWPPSGVTMSEFTLATSRASSAAPARPNFTYTMMPLSSVVSLTDRDDAQLENMRQVNDSRMRAVGADAYMSLRHSLLNLDRGLPENYERDLEEFRLKKNEVLNIMRHRTGTSDSDYVTAATEYNRMIRTFPLCVSVPTISTSVSSSRTVPPSHQSSSSRGVAAPPSPSHQASVFEIRSTVRPLSERQPDSGVSAPSSRRAAAAAPAPIRVIERRSTVPGKRHLRGLSIQYGTDPSLSKPAASVIPASSTEEVDECTLCCEIYTNESAPKVRLNCGHNACVGCVIKIAENRTKHEIHCPFCREEIKKCYLGGNSLVSKIGFRLYDL